MSDVSLTTASLTTTSPITFAATGFNDRFGEPLATDVDFSNFAIKATGDVSSSSSESNVVITKTISGTVTQGEGGEVKFTVDVRNAGEWEFSLVDVFSDEYEEHIGGSPYTYFVSEGPTDPDSCLLDFNPSVKAGEEFRVVIETYDVHGNPTEHMDDAFECTLDDGDAVEVNRADNGTVMCPVLVTAAGPNRLTIVHVPTNTKVASSPISFDVSPAAADAASSTHNLGETKSIVSNPGATVTVQVFPRDAYGNKVVTATGFKVVMTRHSFEAKKKELEDEVRLKKHSEEELKVMVSALESVSKRRQDELKEVMLDSKELKIDKLLGKGGFGVVNLATYWSDGGKRHDGATNEVVEEEAGWKESVIHRDLKPDNMLLTRDWTLKLTDFGEARAQNMGGTMTSVGTPIYIAPEVMRADHYDEKADTWSYGLCLVAMIRAETTLEQFFYQSLRKHKKRATTKGLGLGQMTK
ncbi:hypothetical protein TeGR_g4794 [Tetraparma gracilis]|uniref:Protein kinase domain-containing protein n=1 Tax=Tetraparma gracilis TaxID=2962635 RepID=A0ABQ6NBF8_9STRA|nr:hypothetical protein TeGR_g4794 [Tetraparma gracilis]